MGAVTFPVTSSHCSVDGDVLGARSSTTLSVASRPDAIDVSGVIGQSHRQISISNEGVVSYTPPRTHNTVLDAEELRGWGNVMRACARGLYEPKQETSFRELGAKLDEMAKSRPLRARPPRL